MAIFDFLKASPHADATLGLLTRRHGRWQGKITLLTDGHVPLLLAGGRAAPDPPSLKLARDLIPRYASLRPAIARALFEHYEPSIDGVAGIPRLNSPDQVWAHVAPVRVLIEPMGRVDTVEIAYRTAWDEEHTVGARFQDWALVELNGSVI
ncbi:MAG TPA: hypothetical protein VIJ73_06790 [Methylomirabilota bacterium]